MKKIYVMTDTVSSDLLRSEDSGEALIFEDYNCTEKVGDGCLFVRLQSWDEEIKHPLMNSLIGKKIRITVEVED